MQAFTHAQIVDVVERLEKKTRTYNIKDKELFSRAAMIIISLYLDKVQGFAQKLADDHEQLVQPVIDQFVDDYNEGLT